MNIYISILRGINVSGQKKIIMNDLKVLYEGLGLSNIITYIQSGNVVFVSPVDSITEIKCKIEKAIKDKYGFDVPVDVRTADAYKAIIENCPFEDIDVEKDGTKILVTFLSKAPSADKIAVAQNYASKSEAMVLNDTVLYLHCPDGYGRTKLSNAFLERKLGVSATTRNWKTILKLRALGSPKNNL